MKKLLLALAIVGTFALIHAQTGESDWSVSEDEHVVSTSTETIITNDPITITAIAQPAATEDTQVQNQDMDFVAGMEADVSKNKKVLNIPLWYRWKNFGFNATVPYIIEKKFSQYDWATEKTTDYSTSGLGDVVAGLSYGNFYEPYNFYYDVNLGVKMPTGDPEAKDKKNGFEQIVPLGTDSWDINTAVSLYKYDGDVTFKGKLMYVYNGEVENTLTERDSTYNYDTMIYDKFDYTSTVTSSRGGQFITSLGFDYRWKYRLTFSSDVSFGWNFDGENETKTVYDYLEPATTPDSETKVTSDIYGSSFSDVRQSVTYSYSLFDFVLGLRVPVYTYSNDEANIANVGRNFSLYFKTNYRIF